MNFTAILIAAAVVGLTGLIIGLLLGIAGEKFKVKVDDKEVAVRELLPGNNCGGCGYAGCDGLAKAIAAGTAEANACPVAGSDTAVLIGKVMGAEVEEAIKMTAYVKCAGTCDKTEFKYNYYGIQDCKKLALIPGHGDKLCSYGCMGYGTCVRECPFDAIHIVDGVAVVDKEKCKACSKCIAACPNKLIELLPYKSEVHVACSSTEKGKAVKLACSTGCIGCMLCTKVCPTGAITVSNNLASIQYSLCTNCGSCISKCPVGIIKNE